MKKIICILLSAIMTIGLIAISFAEYDIEKWIYSGDYSYYQLEDGSLKLMGYNSDDEDVTIPFTLDGKPVSAIDTRAFCWNSTLKSITIPDSVINIAEGTFNGCGNLSSIIVSPDHPTLAVINGVLFSKPDKTLICYPAQLPAEQYDVPSGIKKIGDGAFSDNSYLDSITIPDSVTSIGVAAFTWCQNLTTVKLPYGITSISDSAFYSDTSLSYVDIPESVISIGNYAFTDSSLSIVVIPENVTTIGEQAFANCNVLRSVIIPDGVTNIGVQAFYSCDELSNITLPDSVISIGGWAFDDCPVTIMVGRDSYARQYCIENGLNYTYSDALDWLND